MNRIVLLPVLGSLIACGARLPAAEPTAGTGAEILEVKKIWDAAPHNAFTDLVRFRGQWYCVFREGIGHVSPDGALRVIVSTDGEEWESASRVTHPEADLRDAKLTVTPDDRLMLSGAAAYHDKDPVSHQTFAWFSQAGRDWSEPVAIGDPNFWVWRVTWHQETAYGIGYHIGEEKFIRLFKSSDGKQFQTLVPNLFHAGYPNETSMIFMPDETCLCLLRRDRGQDSAQLGTADPPYTEWTWQDLGVRIGGPHMIRLPDGRIVAAGRLYDGKVRTSLLWLDPDAGSLTEFVELPSGGDTSYPGLVWHEDRLWVSYYSSHEGKTSIYLAKVKLPEH